MVTGTGATHTGQDNLALSNSLAWPRRAFTLETTGAISSNSHLLDGNNLWGWFDTGSARYAALTAAGPNLLYAIQSVGGVNHLDQIAIKETNCTDNIDNDNNGLTDGEDPACAPILANNFCGAQVDGTYCGTRFQPATFLDQANQNSSLITCTNHVASITHGVCQMKMATGQDFLVSLDSLTPGDPPNTGHYCNVQWPDGTWDFNWTGATPCATLLALKPNGTVVRAGLYSTTGANHVYAACNNGAVGPDGDFGTASLQRVYNLVGHTANRCIFSVSAAQLPLYDSMFVNQLPAAPNPFSHIAHPIDLAQFGKGETGLANAIDRRGLEWGTGGWEQAYDIFIDEGRPLLAVGGGVVLANGSRTRAVGGCPGSSNQGELYVKYSIGSDPVYRESFVVYYAHIRKSLVGPNQTVKTGQILGYVGASGCTSGYAHTHTGTFRTTNTNAHTAAAPELGYHMDFEPTTDRSGNNMDNDTAIDPLGWANYSAHDPWAYIEWNTDAQPYAPFVGWGAWSVELFKPGKAFHYP